MLQLQATHESARVDLYQIFLCDILDLDNTSQGHAKSDLIHKQLQAELDTRLTLVRQTPKNRSSYPDKISSQCDGLKNIRSVPNSAVNVDRNLFLNRSNNFWQSVNSSERAVCNNQSVICDPAKKHD